MARSVDVRTTDADEAVRTCGEVYFPHRLSVGRSTSDFAMCLRAMDLGPVAVGLLTYTGRKTPADPEWILDLPGRPG